MFWGEGKLVIDILWYFFGEVLCSVVIGKVYCLWLVDCFIVSKYILKIRLVGGFNKLCVVEKQKLQLKVLVELFFIFFVGNVFDLLCYCFDGVEFMCFFDVLEWFGCCKWILQFMDEKVDVDVFCCGVLIECGGEFWKLFCQMYFCIVYILVGVC